MLGRHAAQDEQQLRNIVEKSDRSLGGTTTPAIEKTRGMCHQDLRNLPVEPNWQERSRNHRYF
jgi:hypothetical protein